MPYVEKIQGSPIGRVSEIQFFAQNLLSRRRFSNSFLLRDIIHHQDRISPIRVRVRVHGPG